MKKTEANLVKHYTLRTLVYISGFVVIAFGAVFSLRSGIGLSSWDTLHFALHSLFGFTIGTAIIIVAALFTLAVTIVNKNIKYILMGIPVFMVGILFDFINLHLLADFSVSYLPYQILTYIVALLILPFGGSLLIISQYPAGVFDEFTLSMMRYFKTTNLVKTRVIIEVSAVSVALIVGLIAGIGLGEIKIGTVIFTLLVGTLLKLYLTFFERIGIYETKQND
jgi:uncharacterized membrane protein YczE